MLKALSTPTTTKFDPTCIQPADLLERLQVGRKLPPGWVTGQLPRLALPIDTCVQDDLLGKHKLRDLTDIQGLHDLGNCPFAVARSELFAAGMYAILQHRKDRLIKPFAVDVSKYLKDQLPVLPEHLQAAEIQARALVAVGLSVAGEPMVRDIEKLAESLLISRHWIEKLQGEIASLHEHLSQPGGDIWRGAFVRSLFRTWWILADRDPKPNAGPFQRFVVAAWCSLSPDASETDADWTSAIKVQLSRCSPGEWRNAE